MVAWGRGAGCIGGLREGDGRRLRFGRNRSWRKSRSRAAPPTRWSAGRIPMGQGGVEPPTSRLSGVRSNHLSYWPRTGPQPNGPPRAGQPIVAGAHRVANPRRKTRFPGTVRPPGLVSGTRVPDPADSQPEYPMLPPILRPATRLATLLALAVPALVAQGRGGTAVDSTRYVRTSPPIGPGGPGDLHRRDGTRPCHGAGPGPDGLDRPPAHQLRPIRRRPGVARQASTPTGGSRPSASGTARG